MSVDHLKSFVVQKLAYSLLAILCGAALGVRAADLPPIPAPDYPLVDRFAFSDAKAAQDAWQAMDG